MPSNRNSFFRLIRRVNAFNDANRSTQPTVVADEDELAIDSQTENLVIVSNSTDPANPAVVTLPDGVRKDQVVKIINGGNGRQLRIADGGNADLTANWNPTTAGDFLTIKWNGSSLWQEQARQVTSLVEPG